MVECETKGRIGDQDPLKNKSGRYPLEKLGHERGRVFFVGFGGFSQRKRKKNGQEEKDISEKSHISIWLIKKRGGGCTAPFCSTTSFWVWASRASTVTKRVKGDISLCCTIKSRLYGSQKRHCLSVLQRRTASLESRKKNPRPSELPESALTDLVGIWGGKEEGIRAICS